MAEKAMARIPDEKLDWQYNEECNSITVIVKHMVGNMLSRWTDIFTTDGEKDSRDRDAEFENQKLTRSELMEAWRKGWDRVYETLDSLRDEDLERVIYIRKEPHTVTEAINRQLTHYAGHIGQIIYIAKMVSPDWHSLTIPRKVKP
jgi:uncharacterized damage-inducible protein DinB